MTPKTGNHEGCAAAQPYRKIRGIRVKKGFVSFCGRKFRVFRVVRG
jgi:hypothetical protein